MATISRNCVFLLASLLIVTEVLGECHQSKGHHARGFFQKRCCKRERFDYNHLGLFKQQCNVPPTNQSMTVVDNFWKYFACMMTSALNLNNEPLTMVNFTDVMTAKMSNETKSEVLFNLLDDPASLSLVVLPEELKAENFGSLKKMWDIYFQAEYHTCHREEMDSEPPMLGRFLEVDPELEWQPIVKCLNATYPNLNPYDRPTNIFPCMKRLLQKFNFENYTKQEVTCMESVCRGGELLGFSSKSPMKMTMDFESILTEMVPKFVSTSARNAVFSIMTKIAGSTPRGDVKALVRELKNNATMHGDNYHKEMVEMCEADSVILSMFELLYQGVGEYCEV